MRSSKLTVKGTIHTVRDILEQIGRLFGNMNNTSLHSNSRNRYPLVGIYKDTKSRSKKKAADRKARSASSVENIGRLAPVMSVSDGIISIDTSRTPNSALFVDDVTTKLQELVTAHHQHKVCPNATSQIRRIVADYWTWRLEEAPEFATLSSVHDYDDKLSSVSIEATTRRVARSKEFLEQLHTINMRKLAKDDRLNWKLLKVDLEAYIEGFPWRYHSAFNTVNFMESIPIDFGTFLIDAMKFSCEEDYDKYLSRLRAIPVQVNEEIQLMREAIEHGTTLHKCSIDNTVHNLDEMVKNSAEESPFFSPFEKLDTVAGITNESRLRIKQEGKKIIEGCIFKSLSNLKQFMQTDYLPNTRATFGVSGLPNGSAFYEACLKWHLTTSISPKEVHEIGLLEVARIQRLMKDIMSDLGFEGTLCQFMEVLKNDSRFYNSTMEQMLSEYKQILKDVIMPQLPNLFNSVPNMPLDIVELPQSGPGAQYIPPSVDGSRPGQFQVSTQEFPRFSMMALVLHEGLPGHHLQYSAAMERNLPDFRKTRDYRRIFGAPLLFPVFTAYDEGWALYAEYLGEEMGVYRDSFELFGRYSEEMVRAVRLVVDTGLHLFNWSYDDAVAYMTENTCLSHSDILSEVNRYLTWPGQACAYKIGELKIKELRRLAETRLGDLFSVKDFHDVVLGLGAVPLLVLETEIKDWVERVIMSDSSSDASD